MISLSQTFKISSQLVDIQKYNMLNIWKSYDIDKNKHKIQINREK